MSTWIDPMLINSLPRLQRYAYSLCRDRDFARDAVQETALRAVRAHESFQPGTRFDAWLFRILRNYVIDFYRSRRHEVSELVDAEDRIGGPPSQEHSLQLKQIVAAIGCLPERQRETLLLSVNGLQYQEIADQMRVPVGTVRSRLHRARSELARMTE